MRFIFTYVLILTSTTFIWSQNVPHVFQVPELGGTRAERIASFNVSSNNFDRLEIVNATTINGMFLPTIWSNRQSSNSSSLQLLSTISTIRDNGNLPVMVFVSSIPDTLNLNAPDAETQFPWGNGGTMNEVENRPTFAWLNARTVQMILSANGHLGIGKENPAQKLTVNGNVESISNFVLGDERFIQNSSSISNGLEVVNNLNPISFNWVPNNEAALDLDEFLHSGFVAQELEVIVPHLVSNEGTEKTINYNELIPYLVDAIKTLSQEIEDIKDGSVRVNSQSSTNGVSLVISPNPTKSDFLLKINRIITEPVQLLIFNSKGQLVKTVSYSGPFQEERVNIQELPQDIYIIKIVGATTNIESKIIKQ